jgi:subtilisin family serine protease
MSASLGGSTIQWAEVDAIGSVADSEAPAPNDPEFFVQWGMENTGQVVNGVTGTAGSDIRARAAWHVSTGSPLTVIAVLDSGVNHHDDLIGRVLPGWNVPNLNAVTDDGCSSHGTHVSGILAATGDNGMAVAGMAWQAKILPVVVVNPCSGLSSWLADGLYWAVDSGATVANMSLQYNVGTQYLYDAVLYSLGAGVPLIAAAGNNGAAGVSWPAKWPEVIAVGSLQSNDAAASTSGIGAEVDVAAPGVNIVSTVDFGDTGSKNGTSMACPHVAGTIALMQGIAPTLSIAQLRSALEGTCTDVQAPGIDNTSGNGRINAGAALRATRLMVGLGDLTADGIVDGADLGLLLGAWGQCGVPCPADLSDDGVVDGADLGLLLGSWTTPE